MILRALVEEWPGEVGVFIHELPGAYIGGATIDLALDGLPAAVEAHLGWLASHGFQTDVYDEAEIEIAERLPSVAGRYGPLFDADREPVSSDAIEHALSVAALARRDIIDLFRSVAALRREWTPSPDDWSMATHLRHIAEVEAFYVNRLPGGNEVELPDDPVRALQASARYAEDRLRSLDEHQRNQMVEVRGEQWTTTKILRRMSGHLREHYPWLQALARG